MIYSDIINGRFIDLKSISVDDAEFSYNIRADKRNRDTVGVLAENVEAQRRYIEWQQSQPNDYYFVVLNKKGERIGLVGIYDIQGTIGEYGREVNVGEPTEVMEVGLLMGKFCKEQLGLKKISFVIYANNTRHLNETIKRCGPPQKKVVRSGHEAYYFELSLDEETPMEKKIRRMLDRLYQTQYKHSSPENR